MNIIILGGGRVGYSLAKHLVSEDDDITLVDNDPSQMEELKNVGDIRVLLGYASNPKVLLQAGMHGADLVIAATGDDEVNILACHIAHRINSEAKKICRVMQLFYWSRRDLIATDALGAKVIDHFISPQRLVSYQIQRLIETPGALQVIDFAGGLVRLVAVKAYSTGSLVNRQIRTLGRHLPKSVDARIVAIYRNGQAVVPTGDTVIQNDDEVFFLAERSHIRLMMNEMQRTEKAYKKLTIAGGGLIGYRVAQTLESNVDLIKIIDHNHSRTRYIAERLDKAIILKGDVTDRELMLQEDISSSDVFLALTSNDEANLVSSMLAKSLGVKKVMTLINNPYYIELLESSKIDVVIAPELITVSSMLAFVRQGDTAEAHSLRRGAAEALEVVVHGDTSSSKVVGRTIGELNLPSGITFGSIVRGNQVLMGHKKTQIQDNDHIVVFLTDRRLIGELEQYFSLIVR